MNGKISHLKSRVLDHRRQPSRALNRLSRGRIGPPLRRRPGVEGLRQPVCGARGDFPGLCGLLLGARRPERTRRRGIVGLGLLHRRACGLCACPRRLLLRLCQCAGCPRRRPGGGRLAVIGAGDVPGRLPVCWRAGRPTAVGPGPHRRVPAAPVRDRQARPPPVSAAAACPAAWRARRRSAAR